MIDENGETAELASIIGVSEANLPLLKQALTHKSAASGSMEDNERLEFLGDSVLGLLVNEYLFHNYPHKAEGELTRAKAATVSEPALAEAAVRLDLGKYLLMSKGEEASGGRGRPSMLSDAFEAVIAAVYLDGGLCAARKFVLRWLAEPLQAIEEGSQNLDYKSALQEIVQEWHRVAPNYVTVREMGPDHDKTFLAEARYGTTVLGTGSGRSKKEAEQAAAKEALEVMLSESYERPRPANGNSNKAAKQEDVPGISWRPRKAAAEETPEEPVSS